MQESNYSSPVVGYSVSLDIEGRKKWSKIQSKILNDFEQGMIEDGPSLVTALQIASMIGSGKYVEQELTDEMIKYFETTLGNHNYVDSKVFDKDQLAAIDLLQKYSKLYNETFGLDSNTR